MLSVAIFTLQQQNWRLASETVTTWPKLFTVTLYKKVTNPCFVCLFGPHHAACRTSLPRDRTHGPYIGRAESLPLDHHRSLVNPRFRVKFLHFSREDGWYGELRDVNPWEGRARRGQAKGRPEVLTGQTAETCPLSVEKRSYIQAVRACRGDTWEQRGRRSGHVTL